MTSLLDLGRRDFAPPEIAPGRCDDRGFRDYEVLIGRWGADGTTFEASSSEERTASCLLPVGAGTARNGSG